MDGSYEIQAGSTAGVQLWPQISILESRWNMMTRLIRSRLKQAGQEGAWLLPTLATQCRGSARNEDSGLGGWSLTGLLGDRA